VAIKQRGKSLKSRSDQLSDTFYQLKVLNQVDQMNERHTTFQHLIENAGYSKLKPRSVDVFQINIGKLCNQTCAHCHVDAGPDRKEEQMSREDLDTCLKIITEHNIPKVDITGGAPEMNENFRWFVEECTKRGSLVMNRCNLTIIKANKKYHDLPEFFLKNNVHIISSLPYFTKTRTDSQRGDGVFQDSIEALKMLNNVGYGQRGSDLTLDLVYNPTGAFLPTSQVVLEAEFKRQLKRRYDIDFNNLYAITNIPISRFLEYLIESGNYQDYMQTLIESFNASTIDGLMCRNTLSVSWDGFIYDCDFNQMLDLKVASKANHISKFNMADLDKRDIVLNQHCLGCTAGAGSSCGGEIT
jgi:radical SAM/Cys-rich protein